MTRAQVLVNVTSNLGDVGGDYYSNQDKFDSFQDALDEVCVLTKCVTKSGSINIIADLVYYDLTELFPNYFQTIAIYNDQTKRWLGDGIPIKGFDRVRLDWERWRGTIDLWATCSPSLIALAPSSSVTQGTLTLWYWATVPNIAGDATIPISDDLVDILEFYVTADLLEQAEEWTKAAIYWKRYTDKLVPVRDRALSIARSDLILRMGGV